VAGTDVANHARAEIERFTIEASVIAEIHEIHGQESMIFS